MKLLDLTLPTPAENLACDEALVDFCEAGGASGVLRLWEPQQHFVVVGYSNRVKTEVDIAACAAADVPVFRRWTGGGTILQGPGCLNYSLILQIDPSGPLRSIVSTNRFVLERNLAAVETVLRATSGGRPTKAELTLRGHTDVALGEFKFSGNSQRRTTRFLLFHGTFLLRFDLSLIEKLLRMPSKQPEYRRNRSHSEFLTNLELPADPVKSALRLAWQADESLDVIPRETIALLARDKYATDAWNFKF